MIQSCWVCPYTLCQTTDDSAHSLELTQPLECRMRGQANKIYEKDLVEK